MAPPLAFTPLKEVLNSSFPIERLCISGVISSVLSCQGGSLCFTLRDPSTAVTVEVTIHLEHYAMSSQPNWNTGDALAMIFATNHGGRIESTARNSFIWWLSGSDLSSGGWNPVCFKRGTPYSNLSQSSKYGGSELNKLSRIVRSGDRQAPQSQPPVQPQMQQVPILKQAQSSQIPIQSQTPEPRVSDREKSPILFNEIENLAFSNRLKGPVEILVHLKDRSFKPSHTTVSATDYSTGEFSLTFWDSTKRDLEIHGDYLYISGVTFKNNNDHLYGNVRDGCKIRPASRDEIEILERRQYGGPPPEINGTDSSIIMDDRMTGDQQSVATFRAMEARHAAEQLSGKAMTNNNSPGSVVSANVGNSNGNIRSDSPNSITKPHEADLNMDSSNVSYYHQSAASRPPSNPNIVFHLADSLPLTDIKRLHTEFQSSAAKIQNFHVCGKVKHYEPNDFEDWIIGEKVRFVLYMDDGSTERKLPVIFEGAPAKEFLDLTNVQDKLDHITSQIDYVLDTHVDIAIQAEQDVVDGVLITRFLGYGSQIRPSLKRKRS